MDAESETILQFGGGNFLRAFADTFVHEANERGQSVGRIVVVQSTDGNRAELINRQDGRYHVVIRGIENGEPVDRVQEVASLSRALLAHSQWDEVLECARSPSLRCVISNTTEAGYALDPADRERGTPPRSFPARLLAILQARFEAGESPLTIVPCELIDRNADRLAEAVADLAGAWGVSDSFRGWLAGECLWLNTLVDRIVTGRPAEHPLLAADELLTVAEPFALWVLEDSTGSGALFEHEAILRTANARPYQLRKVRILNGAHTALVAKARPLGFTTVREAVEDRFVGAWIEELLFEEIVPTIEGAVRGAEEFARQTLERFRNPYVEHKLADIALHHDAKLEVRLVPTREEFTAKFGRAPRRLAEIVGER